MGSAREGIYCGLDVEPEVTFRKDRRTTGDMKHNRTSNMRKRILQLGALAVAALAVSAQAVLINLGDNNITLSGGVPLGLGNGSAVLDGNTRNGGAIGAFRLTVNNPQGTPTSGLIYTFCTDLGIYWANNQRFEAVGFSQPGVNPTWTVMPQAIQNASWLYNNVFIPNSSTYINSASQGAAMQLAIWKTLYDTDATGQTSSSFATGRLNTIGGAWAGAVAGAQSLITQVDNARLAGGFPLYTDTWLHPVSDNTQGMLYNSLTPIPEPTTMIAGALLLLPFGASTLRFIRKNRTA